jgi:hypothetical protein
MKPTRRLHAIFSSVVVLVALGLLNQVGVLNAGMRAPARARFQFPSDVFTVCAGSVPSTRVDVSIVVASCNRTASLLRVLPSWLALRGVAEVVMLDWGSLPPLRHALPAALDPRVRVIRAPLEREWNLARAYNLAIQLARGEIILKLDSDTYVQPEFLARQIVRPHEFRRGCSHLSTDVNARHLNGVVMVRREHLLAVLGYDERMQAYGYDDTDLYFRLNEELNLTESCLDFALMNHVQELHSTRGLTRVHHILHKRATSEGLFLPWHSCRQQPSAWQLLPPPPPPSLRAVAGAVSTRVSTTGDAAGGEVGGEQCLVRSVSRPPFFEETLLESDDMLLAHQEALQLYSNRCSRY